MKEGEPTTSNKTPEFKGIIPDPNFVGMNPPHLPVDEHGNVYSPVVGGEPALDGYIDPDGEFHPLIVGGPTITIDALETKIKP